MTTPGVHIILYRGDHVAVVPHEEIEAIQRAVAGPRRVEPHPFLKCGARVEVIRGALEGVEGILVRKKNLCRLVLSVPMLSQSVAVEVNSWDVEPLPVGKGISIFDAPLRTIPSLESGSGGHRIL